MTEDTRDDLELAFSLHVADMILRADHRMDDAERRFLERTFPADQLRARGLVDADGQRTDAYHDAAMRALEALPERPEADRLALLQVFVDAIQADGQVDHDEVKALIGAAHLLELDDAHIAALLREQLQLDLASFDADR